MLCLLLASIDQQGQGEPVAGLCFFVDVSHQGGIDPKQANHCDLHHFAED